MPDPDARTTKGGTGLCTKDPKPPQPIIIQTQQFREATSTNKMSTFWLDVGSDVRLLIGTGQFEAAGALLHEPLKRIPTAVRFDALARWMDALQFVQQDERGGWSIEAFDAHIAANKRDFDARFAKARVLMAEGHFVAAMDELLEIVLRDKAWNDGAARKTYVALLELLTPPKPKAAAGVPGKSAGGIELMGKAAQQEDETTALLSSYRRKLSMALN